MMTQGKMTRVSVAALLAALALAACDSAPAGPPPVTANRVLTYAPVNSTGATEADWMWFFHPELALGAPGGTLDVGSLGYDKDALTPTAGGSLTLGLGTAGNPAARACAVDGPGADLAVYENAFATVDATDGPGTYSEVATVEVSADNATWYAVPYAIDAAKPLVDPARYSGLAGVTPTADGGDRFDLADVIAANPGLLDATFRACYVRLTDGGTRIDDYGNTQMDLYASGADIDAVQALHAEPAAGLAP